MSLSLQDFADNLDGARPGPNYVRGRCPFGAHIDDDPSLVVYEDGHYHCYGCKRHGSWEELWNSFGIGEPVAFPIREPEEKEYGPWYRPSWYQWEDMDEYVEAAHQRLRGNSHHHWYLEDRCLVPSIRPYRLGYDAGWLTVPLYLPSGRLDGVVARAYPGQEKKAAMRYDMPSNQGRMMYVPDWKRWRDSDTVYVVFGVLDAISMAQAGLPTATPTTGKDSFNPRWLDAEMSRVVVIPDRDEEPAAIELAAGLRRRGRIRSLEYPEGCDDPNDVLVRLGAAGLRRLVEG